FSLAALFSPCTSDHLDLHSFPTRRSSDLDAVRQIQSQHGGQVALGREQPRFGCGQGLHGRWPFGAGFVARALSSASRSSGMGTPDRKSTRLNSSHVKISYAVFCLKKKKTC